MSVSFRTTRFCFLLLAATLAWPARATAPGAAFDRLFEQIDSGELNAANAAEQQAQLASLRALVPAGDARRMRTYRTQACYQWLDRPRQSYEFAVRGIADARAAGDVPAEIRFGYCKASYTEPLHGAQAALSALDEAVELARRSGEKALLADGLSMRSDLRSLIGQQTLALVDIEQSQKLYEALHRDRLSELNLLSIAAIYRRMGEYGVAIEHLRRSRAIARRERDFASLISTELQLAFCFEDQNRLVDAERAYQRALALAKGQGNRDDQGFARLGLAYATLLRKDYPGALALLDAAQADFDAARDGSNTEMLALRRGQALAGLGRHAQALAQYARAARALEASGNDRYREMLLQSRADTLSALGRPAEALADYRAYMTVHETLRRQMGDERAQLLRYRFDARARDLENRRLRAEKDARDRELASLDETRRWQQRTLVLGTLLVALLATFIVQQVLRLRRLREQAHTDDLTGVANRRRLKTFGDRAIARAHGLQQPLAALTFDIDHFKRINDTYGHPVGDAVLARVAKACQGALRQGDLLGRTGGEEFVIVLPDTDESYGAQIAERVRRAVEEMDLSDLAPGLRASVSLGLARLRRDDTSLSHLTRRADAALYRAKRQGRNRVETEADATEASPSDVAAERVEPATASLDYSVGGLAPTDS